VKPFVQFLQVLSRKDIDLHAKVDRLKKFRDRDEERKVKFANMSEEEKRKAIKKEEKAVKKREEVLKEQRNRSRVPVKKSLGFRRGPRIVKTGYA